PSRTLGAAVARLRRLTTTQLTKQVAVSRSHWHKFYTADIAAPAALLFDLLADMPNYGRWLPGSAQFGNTTDVQPYPVQLRSRYHDGKPDEPGKDWWGEVVGFVPPGSLDFH